MARCEDSCPLDKRKRDGGNCHVLGDDNLPVQCVGDWARDYKHDILKRYIDASAGPRGKFLHPSPRVPFPGGAAFIDLFAGPGRARIRSTGEVVDGSPLIAAKHDKQPFTKLIFCELDQDNAAALKQRLRPYGNQAVVIPGNCHDEIDKVLALIPRKGLNIALLDPFAMSEHNVETIHKLAEFEHMDLLIHFPTMGEKRNIGRGTGERMKKGLGIERDVWRSKDIVPAINDLRKRLERFDYTGEAVRDVAVPNNQGGIIYHLVYVSKHPKGDTIWQSITKKLVRAKGQLSLGV